MFGVFQEIGATCIESYVYGAEDFNSTDMMDGWMMLDDLMFTCFL